MLAMAKSQRLRLQDLREAFLLLGECCELGADPLAWRRHMVQRLRSVLGAQVALYQELLPVKPHGESDWLVPLVTVDAGWPTASDRRVLEEFWARGEHELCPWFSARSYRRVFYPPSGMAAFTREELAGNRQWYRSVFFNEYVRKAHINEALLATHGCAGGPSHGLVLHRALGEKPFAPRQQRLLRLFFGEHLRLLGTKLARYDAPSVLALPPRLREVLTYLMQGASEKEIALELGISRHTVHYHVKQLHERFGANSRAELLARCRDYWPVLQKSCGRVSCE
jgi:DNA-binding CsgD family transcriptional regulator